MENQKKERNIRTTTKQKEEKYTPDIPALRQAEITSTDRDLGPSVPTIFVIAGKKL